MEIVCGGAAIFSTPLIDIPASIRRTLSQRARTEALGREQTAMLERGEVHIGIRHDQGDRHFQSRILPPDEVLAACTPSLDLGHAGVIDISRLASFPFCYWKRVMAAFIAPLFVLR